ncbi:MAG TPA: hypothetical protein VET24_15475, partial [Actinomycetota bacterium]|nr:hypothetical protein [Actinomycetota bacterium]
MSLHAAGTRPHEGSGPGAEQGRRLRMAITGGLMLAVVLAGFFAAAVDSVVSRLGLERLDAPVTRLVAAHRTA